MWAGGWLPAAWGEGLLGEGIGGAGGRLGVKSQAPGGICRDARAPAASDLPGAARERRAIG